MFKLLVCLLCLIAFAVGQDEVVQEEEAQEQQQQQQYLTSSPFVLTSSVFPRHPNGVVPLGKLSEILIGFKNVGQKAFNVTIIHGSLRHPQDLSTFIQNFTSWRGGVLVRPGQHVTFQYYFFPDELLEPKDYALVVNAYYTDEENYNYASTFYNGTIDVHDEGVIFDLQTSIIWLILIGGFGAGAYYVSTVLAGKGGFKLSSGGAAESVNESERNKEWLEDSNVKSWKEKKEKSLKQKSPSKK
uniref:Uncharacterized protein n=1 Tax=Arcella intermedia TaxID=1963864 RepID=A0A6B2LFV0_9EUKA|eukprot:TRINITY_DN25001_c0_g1_i1.p1 TRINITY_DN25001_c0_g1~~TRINITY_DN25001_c0_g1_i1.p1  ORF type:complete len:243 (-),score=53.71 TRINITY_DN25001_c0_g1_i1:91-819(-)